MRQDVSRVSTACARRNEHALRPVNGRRTWRIAAAVLLAVCLPVSLVWAATQYLYDDLGRLVLVANAGGSIVYEYDANGNVSTITQWSAAQLAVTGFSPTDGYAGQAITIYGSSFSAQPANDHVTIGGVTATVTAATATTLTSTIPYGASTGPIAVTVNGTTATSSTNLVVKVPTITSLTPSVVNPAASVTLDGNNLNLVGSTTLAVGGSTVTMTSLSNTQAVFIAPSGEGGTVTVTTSYGQATSSSALHVVPAVISASNVVAYAVATPNGGAQSVTVNQASKYAVLEFQGVAGQFISLQISSFSTTPSSQSVAYQVYSPSAASIASGSISSSIRTVHLPALPATGRYLVSFASGSSTSVQVGAAVEVNAALALGTPLAGSTAVAGQSKRYTVDLTAGNNIAVALTGLSLTPSSPSYALVTLYRPNGASINGFYCYQSSLPGCALGFSSVPDTGKYQVTVQPGGTSTMSFSVAASQNAAGTLALGTPLNVSLTAPGQQAQLTFTASAGQSRALYINSIATTPANKQVTAYVYNPSGGQVAYSNSSTGLVFNLTNLVAGTYTVLIQPTDASTATLTAKLVDGLVGTLPTDGTSQSFSTSVPGQNGNFTFSATAGDDLGLALTGLTLNPSSPSYLLVNVNRPNGSQLTSAYCYQSSTPGCSFSLLNVPDTGTYQVQVQLAGLSSASYTLTLSQDVTGTLTPGSLQSLNLNVPGRQGWLSFTATAGQTFALNAGSIATTPSGKYVTMSVFNAAGTQVATASGAAGATVNVTNLAAGTYNVWLQPADAATATLNVTLANGIGGTLPTNGTSQTLSTGVPAQNGYFTFSATAGDDLGLGLTGLSLTPSSPSYVYVIVYRPNGAMWVYTTCSVSSTPGCGFDLTNAPDAGTYRVVIQPAGLSNATYTLTLSQNVTGTLSSTPLAVNLDVPGRQGWPTFTATAGQNLSVTVNSIATTPSGKYLQIRVLNSSGTQITATGTTTGATLNLTNLAAGTYNVMLQSTEAATATMNVTVQ